MIILKNRILTNWTLARVLYLLLGVFVAVQSIANHHWGGILIGCYFASMGLFAFGCASGNCGSGSCVVNTEEKKAVHNSAIEEVS